MKILGYIIVIALLLAIVAGSLLWTGFVLSTLWAWFVLPLGAPSLTVLQAAGIGLVVRFMTYQFNINEALKDAGDGINVKNKRELGQLVWMLVWPALTLVTGWIIHKFI